MLPLGICEGLHRGRSVVLNASLCGVHSSSVCGRSTIAIAALLLPRICNWVEHLILCKPNQVTVPPALGQIDTPLCQPLNAQRKRRCMVRTQSLFWQCQHEPHIRALAHHCRKAASGHGLAICHVQMHQQELPSSVPLWLLLAAGSSSHGSRNSSAAGMLGHNGHSGWSCVLKPPLHVLLPHLQQPTQPFLISFLPWPLFYASSPPLMTLSSHQPACPQPQLHLSASQL